MKGYWEMVFGGQTVDDVMRNSAWLLLSDHEQRFEPWLRDRIRLMLAERKDADEEAAFCVITEKIADQHGTFSVTGGARYGAGNTVIQSWDFDVPIARRLTLQEAVDEARKLTVIDRADAANPCAVTVEYCGRGRRATWHVFKDSVKSVK